MLPLLNLSDDYGDEDYYLENDELNSNYSSRGPFRVNCDSDDKLDQEGPTSDKVAEMP
jgi:hypothetical protein